MRGSAGRACMGCAGSFMKLYWKPTKRLRGSGVAVGGGGFGTGGGVSGGGEIFGTAKWAFTCRLVNTSPLFTLLKLVLRPSSVKGMRNAPSRVAEDPRPSGKRRRYGCITTPFESGW